MAGFFVSIASENLAKHLVRLENRQSLRGGGGTHGMVNAEDAMRR
jgi:hypothetical protein